AACLPRRRASARRRSRFVRTASARWASRSRRRAISRPAPSRDDVALVARRVRDRAVRGLRRKGYIDERAAEDRTNDSPEPSALEACTQLALAGGAFLARPGGLEGDPDADLDRRERRFSATCDDFDVHCAVRIAAGDDQGRERLARYCTH